MTGVTAHKAQVVYRILENHLKTLRYIEHVRHRAVAGLKCITKERAPAEAAYPIHPSSRASSVAAYIAMPSLGNAHPAAK